MIAGNTTFRSFGSMSREPGIHGLPEQQQAVSMTFMRRIVILSAPVFCAAVWTCSVRAGEAFFLKDGQTVVFFGDSITENGLYVEYVDAFVRTRFPAMRLRVFNRGISSETLSGTSEADHQPRRPCALDRFSRDVASLGPDVVVACFGMNDGNYLPFETERFARFQAGVKSLIERTNMETKATLVLLTPPPYDPYRRRVLLPTATQYGYQFPAVDYDNTLQQYGHWMLTIAERNVSVVDLHAAMSAHLRGRREKNVSFSFQDDGIHPNATGHWLMAQTLLAAWNAPAVCDEACIDAAGLQVRGGAVVDLRREGHGLGFTWRTALPMPMDERWDAESIALEQVRDRFNRHRLVITGLARGRYRLLADGEVFATAGDDQLKAGLDLLECPAFPTNVLSQRVLAGVRERQRVLYNAWRRRIAASQPSAEIRDRLVDAETKAERIEIELRRMCEPKDVRLRIEPIQADR